jgi:hypothetical protein
MNDTSGPNLFGSFESADPPSSSESKSPPEAGGNGTRGHRDCAGCKTSKPSSEFYTNSKGGYRKHCKECWRQREMNRKRATDPAKRSANFKAWRRANRAKALISIAKYRARMKGLYFDLDQHTAAVQGVLDAGVCELTGIPFNLDGGKTWDSPSLDRIDPAKGYTLPNVRVVLYCVNVMANLWGADKIIEIADAIMSRRRDRSAKLQKGLESALKRQIDLNCSPEYALTWRHVAMSSGAPILRLRASARRTSASGCSGSRCGAKGSNASLSLPATQDLSGWPTPRSADSKNCRNETANRSPDAKGWHKGMTLLDAADSLAGWPTPMAGSPETEAYNAAGNTDSSRKTVELVGWATPTAGGGEGGDQSDPEKALERIKSGRSNLDDMACLAGWATPKAADGPPPRDPAKRLKNDRQTRTPGLTGNYKLDLSDQVGLTPGDPSPSSPAGTARRGVLNPDFTRWLMGYPAAWGCCGATAMRSCRKSRRRSSGRS